MSQSAPRDERRSEAIPIPSGVDPAFGLYATKTAIRDGPDWERGGSHAIGRLFETIRSIFFSPAPFFQSMRLETRLLQPRLFAILCILPAMMFLWVLQFLISGPTIAAFPPGVAGPALFQILLAIFLPPALFAIVLFGYPAVLRFTVGKLCRKRLAYEAAVRIVCYSFAAHLLMLIPCLGQFLTPVWFLFLVRTGLIHSSGVDSSRAVAAAILAFFLLALIVEIPLLPLLILTTVTF